MKTILPFLLISLYLAVNSSQAAAALNPITLAAITPPTKYFTLVAQRSILTVDEGVIHRGFSFNGTSPGPLMIVNEGDNVEITVKNKDTITHGLSMHAANTQTSLQVGNLQAGATRVLKFTASVPGIYMYHCAPGGHGIMTHTMGGMFGMFVVEPKQKFMLEQKLRRAPDVKVYLVQHETYANGRDFFDGQPVYVAFNGYNFRYANAPINVRPGDYIRFYYVNVGPNLTSTFHAVGGIWNYVYAQGNPANMQIGGQSVITGPSDSYAIDWQVPAAGPYTLVSHAFGTQAAKGAIGIINAVKGAPRPNIIRSEGPILALPKTPKRIIDPFGIGTYDIDRTVHFHKGDKIMIEMVGNSFFPKVAEVPVNSEVTWVNEDVFDALDGERTGKHFILSTSGPTTFVTPSLAHAERFTQKFTKTGVYQYYCPIHPYMKAQIKVY